MLGNMETVIENVSEIVVRLEVILVIDLWNMGINNS